LTKDDNSLFFAQISTLQRQYSKALSMRLDPYDVKPGYLNILYCLWQKDNITQKALNDLIDIEQATLSNTLSRMDRDGLIERTANPKDRRRIHITLSDKGKSLEGAVGSAIEDLQSIVNTGLTVNDRRYFNRIMRQMTEQIENDLNDPCLMLFDEISD